MCEIATMYNRPPCTITFTQDAIAQLGLYTVLYTYVLADKEADKEKGSKKKKASTKLSSIMLQAECKY